MPMIGKGAIPLDQTTAAYEPSTMATLGQFLFGNDGSWADSQDHLRQLQYQQAMRPVQAQAMQQWMSRFGGGQPQQAGAPAQPVAPEPAAVDPNDLQGMMTAGLGRAVQTAVPQMSPASTAPTQTQVVPQRRRGIVDLDNPDDQATLVGGQMFGMPGANALMDVAKATQRKGVVVNNRLLDEHDPSAYNQYYGDAPAKGSEPVYDRNGKEVGWRMANGALQVIGDAKEAETLGATRGGLVDAPTGNGGTRKMLGGQYIDAMTPPAPVGGRRSGPVVPQVGAPAAAPGYGGLGYTPSPAEQELAKGRVATQVKREDQQPQAYAGLVDQGRSSELTANTLHEILGDVRDPRTGAWSKGNGGMVSGWTTGLGANLSSIKGTPAHNLQAKLDQIRAVTGFDELSKMRQNSPTGGALGSVSEQENRLLQSVRGSLDQGQSGDQLEAILRQQLDQLDKLAAQRQQLYGAQYGGASQSGPQAGGYSRAELQAEARRRGLVK